MKLAIIEPRAVGHYIVLHVRHIAREALARGWQVRLVTSQEALAHEATRTVLAECGERLQVSCMDDGFGRAVSPAGRIANRWELLGRQWRQYRAYAAALRKMTPAERPEAIYVVNLGSLDKMMAVLGSPFGEIPFAGALLSVRFHHAAMGVMGGPGRAAWLQAAAFGRLLRQPALRRLFTIDEALPAYLEQRTPRRAAKVRYVPDLAAISGRASRAESRARFQLADNDCVVLVYGWIWPHKGVEHLLRAAATPACGRVVVVLAGTLHEQVEALLERADARFLRNAGRLRVERGLLDDEQEWQAFQAADIVWLGYAGFPGMSGVLVQAASLGLPVLACREGLIGWMCRKYAWGEAVEVRDPRQVAEAIQRLAADTTLRRRLAENAAVVAEKHSPQSFAKTICDGMAACLR
jgi:glycosyltransferase involved in cell wall biosynthesis